MIKKILALIVVAAIAVAGVRLIKERKSTVENMPTPKLPNLSISLTKAYQGSIEQKEGFLALLQSQREVKISTKLSGYVKDIMVTESQSVKRGDTLIVIDNRELLASLKSLKASLSQQNSDYALTKKIYERNYKLYKAGALPKEKLEELRLGLDGKKTLIVSTQEKINQLNIQLEYLKIKAPFDGIVGNIFIREGDLSAPGKPIMTLSQTKQKMTFSFVSGKNSIKRGQTVLKDNKPIGKIKIIYTQAKNGLSVAEVELKSRLNLPEGSFVSISVVTQTYKGCIVPANTLVHKNLSTQIMLYKEERFTPLDIKVIFENSSVALIKPCPNWDIAKGSETKLSKLPFYDKVKVRGGADE
ncbi:Membrane-fusion protein [hydrothermal vent metagenome]|uniref:Membrane-fusion protein n=1 Tax=hydrothermal vent metagenome TaxID=652676 RepID=A0A1W1BBL8_9ZZZZ